MVGNVQVPEQRPLALTPTWAVATILTIFVAISMFFGHSISNLSYWLMKTRRKPLLAALEKMKEEMMMLGFISLLLSAASSMVSKICIPSKLYSGAFAPCTKSEVDKVIEKDENKDIKSLMVSSHPHLVRRTLIELTTDYCKEGHEPFVAFESLEQLHRFIFVMAVTHIFYSCLTMLLAVVKIRNWKVWENEVHMDHHIPLDDIARHLTMQNQSTLVKCHTSNPWVTNRLLIWVTCFFRQFWHSVVRTDYLMLRKGFIVNHKLTLKYDFHSYMIRNMEVEFEDIVGLSFPLWGFVVAFMLLNIGAGYHVYFWLAFIPIALVLLVGTKLQHVIATLAFENAQITGFFSEARLKPRDELFWFNRPELLLSLIHFILFQNSFELASFFWYWWQFGYNSCFVKSHLLMYLRLILGFIGVLLCSYSTLPLYALVTQMGSNYKGPLNPQSRREKIYEWEYEDRRKRMQDIITDDSTTHSSTSTVLCIEEENQFNDDPGTSTNLTISHDVELQPVRAVSLTNESSNRVVTTLHRPFSSVSLPPTCRLRTESISSRSSL